MPVNFNPQFPASANHVGRQVQQQAVSFDDRCLQLPVQGNAVYTDEQVEGNHAGQKQCVFGQEVPVADGCDGKTFLKFINHLLHHRTAVVKPTPGASIIDSQ